MLVEGLVASLQPGFIDATSAAADGYMSILRSAMERAQKTRNVAERNQLLEDANQKLWAELCKVRERAKVAEDAFKMERKSTYHCRARLTATTAVLNLMQKMVREKQEDILETLDRPLRSHHKRDGSRMTLREYVYYSAYVKAKLSYGLKKLDLLEDDHLNSNDVSALERVPPMFVGDILKKTAA